jgi:glycosyltransferase involved in cell wall biosynthesis
MNISVIIATYNRSKSLEVTLQSFCALSNPERLSWELLIVDNNSNDDTPTVAKRFESRLPIRYMFEPQPGKSHALNHALAEAKGDLLLFTDDDVDPDPQWMNAHWRAAQQSTSYDFFGGKIIPRWEKPPPAWLAAHCHGPLRSMSVSYDLGEEQIPVSFKIDTFMGANLSFRNGLLQKAGVNFPTHLGPTGKSAVRGEETWVLEQLIKKGFRGLYLPDAIVHHRNSAERMTESYLWHWHTGEGAGRVRVNYYDDTPNKQLFGAPRYLWRRFLTSAAAYAGTRCTSRSGKWIRHAIETARMWGAIGEFRSRRNLQQRSKR